MNKQIKHNNQMKKQNTKTNELQERQSYVPASVKVITASVQMTLCASPSSVNDPFGGTEENI